MPISTLMSSGVAHAVGCALAIALTVSAIGAARAEDKATPQTEQDDKTQTAANDKNDPYQSWELVVGPSFGLDASNGAARADVWAGARFVFFEAAVFATSLRLQQDALAPGVREREANGRAVGVQIGLAYSFGSGSEDASLRIGIHARFARAGLDENLPEVSEGIAVAGWAAQGLASIGLGNSTYEAYEPRWWIGALGGISAIWVTNVGVPWGEEARYDDQVTLILGLGFEAGYNVPVD